MLKKVVTLVIFLASVIIIAFLLTRDRFFGNTDQTKKTQTAGSLDTTGIEAQLKNAKTEEGNQVDAVLNAQSGAPIQQKMTPQQSIQPKQTNSKLLPPPQMKIDKTKSYTALLHTTLGDITIALNASATPQTVNNFVYLASNKFYDNTIFHRVIKGFMIQGGDPKGDGTGGPGYTFTDEPFQGDYKRGVVAMANSGPNTNGSQFFIMHQDNNLPKNYVIFGHVVSGIETVDKIANSEVTTGAGGESSKPVNPTTVQSVEIKEE